MTLVHADTGEVVTHSLAECEAVIERGLTTFIEVGQALMAIRDGRLYRATHGDFDSYCRERWGWNRAHAHRMIGAAEVVEDVSPMGDTPPPANERQARPLGKLDTPEERRAAWGEANRRAAEEQRPVTARDVDEAVRDIAPPRPRPEPLTAEEQRAADTTAALKRTARYLTQIIDCWPYLRSVHAKPEWRDQVLPFLTDADRDRLAEIEEQLR